MCFFFSLVLGCKYSSVCVSGERGISNIKEETVLLINEEAYSTHGVRVHFFLLPRPDRLNRQRIKQRKS